MTKDKTHRTRRQLLKGAAATTSWLALSAVGRMFAHEYDESAEEPLLTPAAHLPLVARNYPSIRVIHVHCAGASELDGQRTPERLSVIDHRPVAWSTFTVIDWLSRSPVLASELVTPASRIESITVIARTVRPPMV